MGAGEAGGGLLEEEEEEVCPCGAGSGMGTGLVGSRMGHSQLLVVRTLQGPAAKPV